MTKPLAIALVCLFVTIGAAQSQPSQPPKSPDTAKGVSAQRGQQSNNPAANQQSAQQPINVTVTTAPKSPQDLEADRREREREIAIQAQNRTFTGLLVIVAAITAFVVGWQAWETRKAANAAADSVKTAQRHMYMSLRARMGLKSMTGQALGPNLETSFTFVFENFGGKGAMLQDYCVVLSHETLPQQPVYPDNQWREIGIPVERGGTYTMFLMLNPPLTDAVWSEILKEDGTKKLTIYGVLRYNAGFGKRTKRIGFRREYDPKLSRYKKQIEFGATGGPAYNYAD